jgi:competence protein ComGC
MRQDWLQRIAPWQQVQVCLHGLAVLLLLLVLLLLAIPRAVGRRSELGHIGCSRAAAAPAVALLLLPLLLQRL